MLKAKDRAQEDQSNLPDEDKAKTPREEKKVISQEDQSNLPDEDKAKTPREEKKVISQEGPWKVQKAPVSGTDCV